jgi:hypothetical protein
MDAGSAIARRRTMIKPQRTINISTCFSLAARSSSSMWLPQIMQPACSPYPPQGQTEHSTPHPQFWRWMICC